MAVESQVAIPLEIAALPVEIAALRGAVPAQALASENWAERPGENSCS
jgi:hypothetical protein